MACREQWSDRLAALAAPLVSVLSAGEASAYIAEFADELGNRLAIDAVFLSHAVGVAPEPPVAGLGNTDEPLGLDEVLWRQLLAGSARVPLDLSAAPPLLDRESFGSIEVWTESLLCSLHALGWLQWRDASGGLGRRVQEELAWLIEHLEPDNATRHPWCVHLFLDRAIIEEDPQAMLYAEELIHVCQVGRGRASKRSAWILFDAARYLRIGASERMRGS